MNRCFVLTLVFLGILLSGFLFGCRPPQTVHGKVASVYSYEAIANATVQIGNKKVTTGSDGSFSITVENCMQDKIIEISKAGFVGFSKPLSDYTGDKIYIDAFMMPVDKVVEIDPAKPGGNVISDSKGAKVTLPALSGIAEPLIVEMASFNVSTEDINAVPGNMTAIDAHGKTTSLISQGMLSVTVTGKNSGKKFDLKGYGNYIIEIPVTGNIASAPHTISLWYYDNTTGKWKEEGSAVKDGNVYRGAVTHFTVWNTDMACTENCTISGRIADPAPVSEEVYEIKLIANGIIKIFTQQDSTFSFLRLPLSTNMTVEVKKTSTQEVWSKDFTTPSTDGATLDIGVFPGPGYLPNVHSLKVIREIGAPSVTLSWERPLGAEFIGVRISYVPLGGGMPASPVTLSADTLSQQFTNLTPGALYVFTVNALYTGDRSSQGLSRSVFIYSAGEHLLTITDYINKGDVFVTVDGNRMLYTSPMIIPDGLSVQLEAVPFSGRIFLEWTGDINETSNPVTFVMDSDKTISPQLSLPPSK